jgi:hypothetical protein
MCPHLEVVVAMFEILVGSPKRKRANLRNFAAMPTEFALFYGRQFIALFERSAVTALRA